MAFFGVSKEQDRPVLTPSKYYRFGSFGCNLMPQGICLLHLKVNQDVGRLCRYPDPGNTGPSLPRSISFLGTQIEGTTAERATTSAT